MRFAILKSTTGDRDLHQRTPGGLLVVLGPRERQGSRR
jgi:hypothetical protein